MPALSSPLGGAMQHNSIRLSVRPLLACSLPALVQCRSGGVVEMLRKLCSPLIGWFDTAVVCPSDLCVIPTSRGRVRRTRFCSLCLSHGCVVEVEPCPAESMRN